jgi:hypothetical protein
LHDGSLLLHQLRVVEAEGDVCFSVRVSAAAASCTATTRAAAARAAAAAPAAGPAALALLLPAEERGSAQDGRVSGLAANSKSRGREAQKNMRRKRASPCLSGRR